MTPFLNIIMKDYHFYTTTDDFADEAAEYWRYWSTYAIECWLTNTSYSQFAPF